MQESEREVTQLCLTLRDPMDCSLPGSSVYGIFQAGVLESVAISFSSNAGGPGSIPGLGRSPGEGIGYSLQYSSASLVAQMVKNPPAMLETWVGPWVGKIPWRRTCQPPHGLRGMAGSCPWGRRESDTTERLSTCTHMLVWADLNITLGTGKQHFFNIFFSFQQFILIHKLLTCFGKGLQPKGRIFLPEPLKLGSVLTSEVSILHHSGFWDHSWILKMF